MPRSTSNDPNSIEEEPQDGSRKRLKHKKTFQSEISEVIEVLSDSDEEVFVPSKRRQTARKPSPSYRQKVDL